MFCFTHPARCTRSFFFFLESKRLLIFFFFLTMVLVFDFAIWRVFRAGHTVSLSLPFVARATETTPLAPLSRTVLLNSGVIAATIQEIERFIARHVQMCMRTESSPHLIPHLRATLRAVPLALRRRRQSHALKVEPLDLALQRIRAPRQPSMRTILNPYVRIVAADHLTKGDTVADAVRRLVGIDRHVEIHCQRACLFRPLYWS
jgi:hypothetical protein